MAPPEPEWQVWLPATGSGRQAALRGTCKGSLCGIRSCGGGKEGNRRTWSNLAEWDGACSSLVRRRVSDGCRAALCGSRWNRLNGNNGQALRSTLAAPRAHSCCVYLSEWTGRNYFTVCMNKTLVYMRAYTHPVFEPSLLPPSSVVHPLRTPPPPPSSLCPARARPCRASKKVAIRRKIRTACHCAGCVAVTDARCDRKVRGGATRHGADG